MNRPGSLLRRTWHAFSNDHCTLLAAAIAYYVLFSFIPLVTLMIAIFGLVMRDPQSQRAAFDRILQAVPLGQNVVFDSLRNVSAQSGPLTLIGLAGLVWASSGLFGAVRSALDIAWGVEAGHGFVRQRLRDVGAALGPGILLVASTAGTVAFHFLQTLGPQSGPGSGASDSLHSAFTFAGLLLPIVMSFLAFLLIYREVPNVRHGVGDIWPGALLAAGSFELCKHGFALYVSHFNNYQAVYGVLGGVMLFVLWAYLTAIVLLLGAEFASEFEKGRHPVRTETVPVASHS